MQRIGLFIAVLAWGAVAAAQSNDARRPQLDAAVANAVEGLYQEVARAPIHGAMTAGEFADKVNGRQAIISTLQGAQQIGGPRWLDDQTAQIRLEIAGTRVAQTLIQLATSNPHATPVRADALATLLVTWQQKTFGAVGTSTGASAVAALRPMAIDATWAAVPEQARRDALVAARRNAVQRVLDRLRPVHLTSGLSLGDLMERPDAAVSGTLEQYLMDRPITGVQFLPDRQVEIGLAVPPEELADRLRSTIEPLNDPALAEVEWSSVSAEIVRALGTVTGIGSATATRPAVAQSQQVLVADQDAPPVRLPEEPPDWAWRQIDADASASHGESALKCARAAENAAVDKLRLQIEALPLNGITVGEAARKDARIADAVARGIRWARVYKTDYQADGSATVYVSLELRDVWEQLRRR